MLSNALSHASFHALSLVLSFLTQALKTNKRKHQYVQNGLKQRISTDSSKGTIVHRHKRNILFAILSLSLLCVDTIVAFHAQ